MKKSVKSILSAFGLGFGLLYVPIFESASASDNLLREVPLPFAMKSALKRCNDAAKKVSDTIINGDMMAACVSYSAFTTKGHTRDEVVKSLSAYHRPQRTGAKLAADTMYEYIKRQVQLIRNLEALSDADLAKEMSTYAAPSKARIAKTRNMLKEFREAINAQTKQVFSMTQSFEKRGKAEILMDDDTYWAPSVNARVIYIVDYQNQLVYEFLHGETDG